MIHPTAGSVQLENPEARIWARGEEHQHVVALKQVASNLGTPTAKPTGKFPPKSAASVAKLAATVENLGAAAYLGQAGNIKSKEI